MDGSAGGAIPERHEFGVAQNAVWHFIESQAGSIEKALLEAVMNAVDAHATRVDITLEDAEHIVVADNGEGLGTREEIVHRFGTFGFDHGTEEEAAKGRMYGRFGIGRGQLMAFGRTVWRSGGWRLEVDVRRHGAGYTLAPDPDGPREGCRIEVAVYQPVRREQRRILIEELTSQVRYVPCEIHVDGVQRSKGMDGEPWTEETPTLLFLARTSSTGVKVYNQGCYLTRMPHHRLGVSGVLCSKPGASFLLNTARNDIVAARCPLWAEARALLARHAGRRRETAERLEDEDRQAILHELRFRSPPVQREHWRTPLFRTVHGRYMSAKQVAAHGKGVVTVAPGDNLQPGERAHTTRVAAVLAPRMLEWTGHDDLESLATWMVERFRREERHWGFSLRPRAYEEVVRGLESGHSVVPPKEWTPTERTAMKAATMVCETLGARMGRPPRTLHLGVAADAAAWTDGRTYIVVERKFLVGCADGGLDGWGELLHTLVHEYVHGAPSVGAHGHPPEFYVAVHDFILSSRYRGMELAARGLRQYCTERERKGLKERRRDTRSLDLVAEAERAQARAQAAA